MYQLALIGMVRRCVLVPMGLEMVLDFPSTKHLLSTFLSTKFLDFAKSCCLRVAGS